ncbi:hypothetical protein B0H13DRAFT_2010906 [Mycena leptocephala]|nr:hypothetical protein B0H13DRAFT_2010906 [Mycena leptocephala]
MAASHDYENQNPSCAPAPVASTSKQVRDGDGEVEVPHPRSWGEVPDSQIPRGWQPPPHGTRPTVTRAQMVALAKMLATLRLPKKKSTAKAGAARRASVGAAEAGTRNEKREGDGEDARTLGAGCSCCIGIGIDTSSTPSIRGFETTCSVDRTRRYDDDTLCICGIRTNEDGDRNRGALGSSSGSASSRSFATVTATAVGRSPASATATSASRRAGRAL